MDERTALTQISDTLTPAGDDAATLPLPTADNILITTDMLHASTDFPDGVNHYTAGWRAVGASLSDLAAMGATATAAVAVYGVPAFSASKLSAFLRGASDVCSVVGAEYVGGDLDTTHELTVATTAIGESPDAVSRSGATPGDVVCVTDTLGQTAAALCAFHEGNVDQGNSLFQFTPRVRAGVGLGKYATAMMDSSDGVARSLHQLGEASDVGFAITRDDIPVHPALSEYVSSESEALSQALTFGEDFELVFTVPSETLPAAKDACPVSLHTIGEVQSSTGGITLDSEPLPDTGYTHGDE
ncbi:MAG: thiamine-monophosphate kinase [Haloquadratum sp. J07HQX50]|nr:MAG: thiamine-monophosphate kinase [Haloquadratum sp. J07HQX50]